MPERKTPGSFTLQLLVLLLGFLGALALLANVYGKSAYAGRSTAALNKAVDTCRSAAEIYKAVGIDGVAEQLGGNDTDPSENILSVYLNNEFTACNENEGCYVLLLQQTDGESKGLNLCTVSVGQKGGSALYSLDTARFVAGKGGTA